MLRAGLLALICARLSVAQQCPPGKYKCPAALGPCQKNCLSCTPGRYSATSDSDACQQCAEGKHMPAVGAVACISCAAGKFSANASEVCRNCEDGQFSGAEAGVSQWAPSGHRCEPTCPSAMGTVPLEDDSTAASRACVRCPAGKRRTEAKRGQEHGVCATCDKPHLCPGGDSCREGHDENSAGCLSCKKGFYRASADFTCKECMPVGSEMIFFAICAVLLAALVIYAWIQINNKLDEKLAFYAYMTKATLFLNYMQLSWLTTLIDMDWPVWAIKVYAYVTSFFTIDLGQATSPECGFLTSTFLSRYVITSFAPIFAAALALFVMGPLYRRHPWLQDYFYWPDVERKRTRRVFRRTCAFTLTFFYTFMVSNTLRPLECVRLETEDGSYASFLKADTTMRCWQDPLHVAMALLAIILGSAYAFILPCFLQTSILRLSATRYRKGTFQTRLHAPPIAQRLLQLLCTCRLRLPQCCQKRVARGGDGSRKDMKCTGCGLCSFNGMELRGDTGPAIGTRPGTVAVRFEYLRWEFVLMAQKSSVVLVQKLLGDVSWQGASIILGFIMVLSFCTSVKVGPYVDTDMNLLSNITFFFEIVLLGVGVLNAGGSLAANITGTIVLVCLAVVSFAFVFIFVRFYLKDESKIKREEHASVMSERSGRGVDDGGANSTTSPANPAVVLVAQSQEHGNPDNSRADTGFASGPDDDDEHESEPEPEQVQEFELDPAERESLERRKKRALKKLAKLAKLEERLGLGQELSRSDQLKVEELRDDAPELKRRVHQIDEQLRGVRKADDESTGAHTEDDKRTRAAQLRSQGGEAGARRRDTPRPCLSRAVAVRVPSALELGALRTGAKLVIAACEEGLELYDGARGRGKAFRKHGNGSANRDELSQLALLVTFGWTELSRFALEPRNGDNQDESECEVVEGAGLFSFRIKGKGVMRIEADDGAALLTACRAMAPRDRKWSAPPDAESSGSRAGPRRQARNGQKGGVRKPKRDWGAPPTQFRQSGARGDDSELHELAKNHRVMV